VRELCEALAAHVLRVRRVWKAIGHCNIAPDVTRPAEEVLVVIIPPHAGLAAQAVEKCRVLQGGVANEADLIWEMVLLPEVRVSGWNTAECYASLGATTFHRELRCHDWIAPLNARAILAQRVHIVGAAIGK